MQLNAATGPALGPIGSAELEQTVRTSICTDIAIRGLILLHTALRHLKPQPHHVDRFLVGAVLVQIPDQRRHILLAQAFNGDPTLIQPALKLADTVRVFQAGQLLRLICHFFCQHPVAGNRLGHQLMIDQDAPVVDPLIHVVVVPLGCFHRKHLQLVPYNALGTHVL